MPEVTSKRKKTMTTTSGATVNLSALARELGIPEIPQDQFDIATGRSLGPHD